MKNSILLVTTLAFSLCNGAMAVAQMQHDSRGIASHEKQMMVEGAWARASVGRNGAAFVTLVNKSDTDDQLVGAKSDLSPRVELHTNIMDGNVMRMRQVKTIPVPAGKSVTLKPGGLHVMIIGLNKKLVEGETFPLTLFFEKAGQITIRVPIKKLGAMGGGHGGSMGHGSMKH